MKSASESRVPGATAIDLTLSPHRIQNWLSFLVEVSMESISSRCGANSTITPQAEDGGLRSTTKQDKNQRVVWYHEKGRVLVAEDNRYQIVRPAPTTEKVAPERASIAGRSIALIQTQWGAKRLLHYGLHRGAQ